MSFFRRNSFRMTVNSTPDHSTSSSPILDHNEQCASDTSSELNKSDDNVDQQQDVAVLLNSLLTQIDSMDLTCAIDEQPVGSSETISDSKGTTRTLRSHVRKRMHTPISNLCRQESNRRQVHGQKRRLDPTNHQSTVDVLGNLKPRLSVLFICRFQMKNSWETISRLTRRLSMKRIDSISSRSIYYHRINVDYANKL